MNIDKVARQWLLDHQHSETEVSDLVDLIESVLVKRY